MFDNLHDVIIKSQTEEDKEPKYLSFIIKRKYFNGGVARTNAILMYPIKSIDEIIELTKKVSSKYVYYKSEFNPNIVSEYDSVSRELCDEYLDLMKNPLYSSRNKLLYLFNCKRKAMDMNSVYIITNDNSVDYEIKMMSHYVIELIISPPTRDKHSENVFVLSLSKSYNNENRDGFIKSFLNTDFGIYKPTTTILYNLGGNNND